jgi:hypothetical protein
MLTGGAFGKHDACPACHPPSVVVKRATAAIRRGTKLVVARFGTDDRPSRAEADRLRNALLHGANPRRAVMPSPAEHIVDLNQRHAKAWDAGNPACVL